MADPFVLSHVRRLPLFVYLSPEQINAVADGFQQVRYAPGDRVYRQGTVSSALVVFVSGGGRILRIGPDGMERDFGEVRAGESSGEETLFINDRRDSSLLITQDSIALVLTKAPFDAILSSRPDIRAVLNMPKNLVGDVQAQQQHNIRADETVLLLTRRHPWAIAGRALLGAIVFAVLLALALLATQITPPILILPVALLGLALVLPGMLAVYYFFEWRNDFFVVTNQRVVHEERYLLTGEERREQALLSRVQNVSVVRHGLIAELIGFGDVVVNTAGSQQPMILNMVASPMHVQSVIFDQMQRQKQSPPSGNTPLPPSPLPQSSMPTNPIMRAFRVLFPATRTVEGERITYRKHYMILIGNIWKPMLFFLLLGLLVGVRLSGRLALLQDVPGIVFWGGALVWLALNTFWWYWAYADWRDDIYILDSASIIDIKRRPLWLHEIRIQAGLQQIQNVTSYIGGVWQQLFGYGTVEILTAAEHGTMRFKQVARPNAIAEEILQRVQQFTDAQAVNEQNGQRRVVEEYLAAAYRQSDRNNPAYPASHTPVPPVAAPPSVLPAHTPGMDRTQPIRPPRQADDSPYVRTASMKPIHPQAEPPPSPEQPDLDQTQVRRIDADTQPTNPPRPPDAPL
ncbi:MAG: cyclic nucleotide-binding domain-containing protein [Anaerolineae bacterium]|nr:cyclic nucleotide-binding domain-containing protein [Anaerolineae bacterium]